VAAAPGPCPIWRRRDRRTGGLPGSFGRPV